MLAHPVPPVLARTAGVPAAREDAGAVAGAFDSLECALGGEAFKRLLSLVMADNGAEFSDFGALEKPVLAGAFLRCRVLYCGVRQSQQKAGCERNHAELRKLLPKGAGSASTPWTGGTAPS